MSRQSRPHTGWRLYHLLDALRRAGWGPLDGQEWKGCRAVLQGLAARLPYGSAEGYTTVEQVAAAAGYGLRWTRRCLTVLEDLGLIEWRRGGVQYGQPRPSWIRISKSMLVDLIRAAREQRDQQVIAWAVATRQRLATIRTIRMIRGKRRTVPTPRPVGRPGAGTAHAAVSADPLPRGGAPKGCPPSSRSSAPAPAPTGEGLAHARAVLARLREARSRQ